MSNWLSYPALVPKQSASMTVCAFCAPAKEVLQFAKIDRIGRDDGGRLRGFQRPQVARHIKEIRNYLAQPGAVLPNSVVVAFTRGASVDLNPNGRIGVLHIDSDSSIGYVVDGQQRLAALAELDKDFEVMVSALLCEGDEELRKQFILINNSKPLPKQLIYELLPGVDNLPERLSSRSAAAAMVERLNYDENSSLHGQIKQHTNPRGVLQDTMIQRMIMSSLSDGALREFAYEEGGDEKGFLLISNFFSAVQQVFDYAWKSQKPKTSRLVHGAGIISMGYVMEYLWVRLRCFETNDFVPHLEGLEEHTAWTNGFWEFDDGFRRHWNDIQNVPRDYIALTQLLLARLRQAQRVTA